MAHTLQGDPLGRQHGGPARLYVAPMYGYKSLKWLARLEVVTRLDDGIGYREQRASTGRVGGQQQRRPRGPHVSDGWVERFDLHPRVHWVTAGLALVLVATGPSCTCRNCRP